MLQSPKYKKAGDLIIAVNGRLLAQNIKKDDFFFQLLDTARPISIGFMRQQQLELLEQGLESASSSAQRREGSRGHQTGPSEGSWEQLPPSSAQSPSSRARQLLLPEESY